MCSNKINNDTVTTPDGVLLKTNIRMARNRQWYAGNVEKNDTTRMAVQLHKVLKETSNPRQLRPGRQW